MATNTYKKLAQGQLSNSAGTLYTAPSATQTIVREIRIANTDSATPYTYTLYQGGTGASNQISALNTSVPAGGVAEISCFLCMQATETIAGVASVASKLTYTINGVEIT